MLFSSCLRRLYILVRRANSFLALKWLIGRWIVTASENDDTEIKIFNYSLDFLSSVDTRQVKNFTLAFSPMVRTRQRSLIHHYTILCRMDDFSAQPHGRPE